MTDMKCPFCGKEMICGGTICRFNPDCPIYDKPVPTEVLELLDRTRKALDLAKERLKNTILDVEILATPEYLASRAKETLDEITALEQKDK